MGEGKGEMDVPNEPGQTHDIWFTDTTLGLHLGSIEWVPECAVCDVPFEAMWIDSSWVRWSE
jgi:hypothetical protein